MSISPEEPGRPTTGFFIAGNKIHVKEGTADPGDHRAAFFKTMRLSVMVTQASSSLSERQIREDHFQFKYESRPKVHWCNGNITDCRSVVTGSPAVCGTVRTAIILACSSTANAVRCSGLLS